MTAWPDRYIGLPFGWRGRDHRSVDCWGLCFLVYAEQLHIELPAYDTVYVEDAASARRVSAAITDARAAGFEWLPVIHPIEFDLVLMTGLVGERAHARRVPVHVGIVAPNKHVLHVEAGLDAVCVPLDHWSVKERISGFYRHRQA